jgi:hypothetical protein
MIQFSGAIGRAYQSLYEPLFPMKDEIEYLTKVEVKYHDNGEAKGKNPKDNE